MKYGAKQRQGLVGAQILNGDLRPGVPIIEICGTERVLIENHGGVAGYSCTEINVKTAVGNILISGENLCLTRMNKASLIVRGKICAVTLPGRG
jgi:sporulation protein YqfC